MCTIQSWICIVAQLIFSSIPTNVYIVVFIVETSDWKKNKMYELMEFYWIDDSIFLIYSNEKEIYQLEFTASSGKMLNTTTMRFIP